MRKFIALVLLAAWLLAACSPQVVARAAQAATPTPLAAIELPATQTVPTPTSGASGRVNDACDNPYYPVVDGAWWQYRLSTGATPTHALSAHADQTFTIRVTGDKTTFTFDGSCTEDGIVLLEVPGVSASTASDEGSSSLTTVNDDGVTLPNDVQIGDEWSQSISLVANAGAGAWSAHIETNYKAVGYEVVSTPDGPINALKVEQTGALQMGAVHMDLHGYIWYGLGIGVVKTSEDDVFEATLTAYAIPQP